MTAPIYLQQLSSFDVPKVRDKANGLLLLPVGATEQHGAHLPICCDTTIAESICAAASARTSVPVLPVLAFTVSSGHTSKWPGTFSLRHETFIQIIEDLTDWTVANGFSRLLIINSHFGNDASLRVAIEKIRLKHFGTLQIGLVDSFKLTEEIWGLFIADGEDLHANRGETNLLLHLKPELVAMDKATDDPDRTSDCVFSYPVAQTSKNGVTGRPSEASAEQGKHLFLLMVEALSTVIASAKNESPPLAENHWKGLCT